MALSSWKGKLMQLLIDLKDVLKEDRASKPLVAEYNQCLRIRNSEHQYEASTLDLPQLSLLC